MHLKGDFLCLKVKPSADSCSSFFCATFQPYVGQETDILCSVRDSAEMLCKKAILAQKSHAEFTAVIRQKDIKKTRDEYPNLN